MAISYKIAVMGDRNSVIGFKALGLDVFPISDSEEAKSLLRRLANGDYAIIYITEQLAGSLSPDIDKYKDSITPAIILIPGKEGSLGIGTQALHKAVERAVGADIL